MVSQRRPRSRNRRAVSPTILAGQAFLPWLSVVAGVVERSALRPSGRVVVTGANGQLGGATVLLALARGAGTTAEVERNAASLARLAALGPRVRPVHFVGDWVTDAPAPSPPGSKPPSSSAA